MAFRMTEPDQTPAELPTPEELVAGLLHLLDVEDLGGDRFTGRRKPGGIGRIFGGQVIGQALASAERTVADDRPVHSLHAYFLRGGNEDHEIDFRVERDLDGRSFSNRRIVASQLGKPILNMVASFHRREDGVHHQDEMPAVAPPEDMPDERDMRRKFIHLIPAERREVNLRPSPIEMRSNGAKHWMGGEPAPAVSHSWFRCVAPLPDDPKVHRAILAYASDMSLLGTCALPHGLSWTMGTAMGASLDHALWFHDDFRADEWLLYATESPWAGRARGMNRGKIFARDGRLVATVAQEGLVRKVVPA
jgi:acyl-CoA thioesterase-2